jgi:hypothetical protein
MMYGSAIFNGRMWLLGGGTYDTVSEPGRRFSNDVWSSGDGITWNLEAATTPWDPRSYHDVAVYDERLWVLSGCNFGGSTLEEKMYRTVDQCTSERNANPADSTLKANPRSGRPDSNRNDVWWSSDGKEWHEVEGAPWLPRHANSVFVFDDSLWMVSGNNGDHSTLESDCWRMQRRVARL